MAHTLHSHTKPRQTGSLQKNFEDSRAKLGCLLWLAKRSDYILLVFLPTLSLNV